MKASGIALMAALLALPAIAQPLHVQLDHLVPEPADAAMMIGRKFSFGLATLFGDQFPGTSRIFAVQQMGPFPPVAIALVQSSDGYDLLGSEVVGASSWAWSNLDGHKEPLFSCKGHVSKSTAEAIIAVWDKMVLHSYDDGGDWPLFPDGTVTIYSSHIDRRIVTGWSGANEGKPRHLRNIVFELHQFCRADKGSRPVLWPSIKDDVAALR